MKKNIKLIAVILLSIFMLSIVGCGTKKDTGEKQIPPPAAPVADAKVLENEKILMEQLQPLPKLQQGEKMGILVITLANPYWVSLKDSYERAAKELGVNIEVMAAPTENDTKSQLETLQAMVAKDYKGLIVSPIEPFNLVPGVVAANKKEIKTVNLGPGINVDALAQAGGHLDGRITVDFEEQGQKAAEYIVEKIGKEGGKVAIIQGIPGAGQSEGRTTGAKKVFENTPGIKLVSVQPANWDRNTAYNITTNLLQSNPDIKGIFCCNDVMALAATDALAAAGKREGKFVFGVDFTDEAKEAIQAGKLDGSIAYSMDAYAKAGILLALKTIQGMEVPKQVNSPLAVVTKENIKEYETWH
ncbi:MAG: substrate-binding domain-containing protein [Syntrophomonas sp.]|nr:substrate-binding domain-containing protein [Syntrophomonas sp.]